MTHLGPTWIPPITCPCGGRHHLGARYYVSVWENPGPVLPVVGPFLTHQEALAWVDPAREEVLTHWNPEGRAHWYAYGTVALPYGSSVVGKLNAALALQAISGVYE